MATFPQSLSLSASHTWAAGVVIAGLVTWYLASNTNEAKARRAGAVLGPGPKRALLVGNLFNFPKGRWYEAFTQWAHEYGDLVYIDVAGLPMVILNSLEAIHELTDKRMNIHSNRPNPTLVCDIMGYSFFLPFLQPDKDFTEQRRLFQKAIGPRVVHEYDSFVQQGCSELLQRLDGFSGEPLKALVKTVGDVLTRMAYGEYFFVHHGQEAIQKNVQGLELLSSASAKLWLVDVIPALRYIPAWFPGATFKRVGNQGRIYADAIRYWSFDQVKAALSAGITDESITSKYLDEGGISESTVRDAMSAMYGAGVDTTTSTLAHFLFCITLYPNWQKRIQGEMDRVLGRGNTPTIDDIPKLTMLNAFVRETLRWLPVAPLGLPHPSLLHTYSPIPGFVLRDPRIWGKDSEDFNPNRFLPEHNPSVDELPDVWSIPFGFGRRICPGRHLAQRTLLFYAAAMLSSYEVLPYEEEHLMPNWPFEDAVIRSVSVRLQSLSLTPVETCISLPLHIQATCMK
ncbi:hypothetical protein PIIN_05418 [Serendipita indica DSM 11827]|uniref:Cytochrome P450 n=1 Tax=Serendipita indica (strain DSM 11827) TaxID=1109443 RepID=G4TJI6_SERID|nr:hypothetical protein PIIN_05418 [Serendipita indica DSM 11827]